MKVSRINEHTLPVPRRESAGAAGFDLRAAAQDIIRPGCTKKIPTGFAWELPEGSVGLVCPRSGIAAKRFVTVLNAPGIIDHDYRGEVGVLLINHGCTDFFVEFGDRIAQLVILPLHAASLSDIEPQEALFLDHTERGNNGFGSTG